MKITEDYVSFEVAKLLKEKGFDELFFFYYRTDEEGKYIHHDASSRPLSYHQKIIDDEVVAAPTLQMVCRWLREIHNLHVDVGYDDLDWFWNIISISKDVLPENRPKFIAEGTACHRTYEEAVEKGLKYTLENLI